MSASAEIEIRAHPGPQESFLGSPADIAIFGGAAGGGKSHALLIDPLRYVTHTRIPTVCFRRTLKQVMQAGGLWQAAANLYPMTAGVPIKTDVAYRWMGGGEVRFAGLEHEQSVLDYQGSQLPVMLWDELTHFTEFQFFYMLSRNRGAYGIAPYVRATCNPDADSWVRGLIDWWIGEDGFPRRDRSGVVRYFARVDNSLEWADSAAALQAQFPECEPKSLTFIAAKLEDNPTLAIGDPGYRANLMALPRVERERLLGGNWNVRASAGAYFQRSWVEVVDVVPAGTAWVRGWDLAGTEPDGTNDPDWTAGVLIGRAPNGAFIVGGLDLMRGSPGKVEAFIRNVASHDGKQVAIGFPQDPGQSGKWQVADFTKRMAGYNFKVTPESGDKQTRFSPFSAQAEHGNVQVLRGPWNDVFFKQCEAFPTGAHDDVPDAVSRGFNTLLEIKGRMSITGHMIGRLSGVR